MRKLVVTTIIAVTILGIGVFYLMSPTDRINDSGNMSNTENEDAVKRDVLASIPERATVSDYQKAITMHGTRKVLWVVFYNNDRFGHLLNQISTGDNHWYQIAKELRKESDAGASEQLDEAMMAAEEKVPSLDPTSPKFVFKGEAFDSYDDFGDKSEIQSLKTALKTNNIPFTVQTSGQREYVYWPRKYTPQVRKINELYYCDPDLPERQTYESEEKFKECLVKSGTSFTTALCHNKEMLIISNEVVDKIISEGFCRK